MTNKLLLYLVETCLILFTPDFFTNFASPKSFEFEKISSI